MALPHAAPGQVVDLSPYGERIGGEQTTAIVKAGLFEVIRLVLREGEEISTHEVDGPIFLHCIEGRAALGLAEGTQQLTAGCWTYLEGREPHSVKGIEDSSLLLTILFPNGRKNG